MAVAGSEQRFDFENLFCLYLFDNKQYTPLYVRIGYACILSDM